MSLELALAWRFIRSRRREGFISVVSGFSLAGISLGVATLIIVMAVMNGFRHDLFEKLLGVNGHISVDIQAGTSPSDVEAVMRQIESDDRVSLASKIIQGEALATSRGKASGAIVRGLDPEDLKKHTLLFTGIDKSADFSLYGTNIKNLPGVIMGNRLAGRLGLGAGSKLTLVAPNGQATPFGTMPRLQSFTVIALMDTGLYDADNAYVFMPRKAAANFLQRKRNFDLVLIELDDPDLSQTVAADLADIPLITRSNSWQSKSSSFYNALQVERNVMFIILTLIIVVAAFNIISGQIMLVRDKSLQIGLLRAIGYSRTRVWIVFLITGAFVGVIGSFVGALLGLAIATNIESIRRAIEKIIGTDLFSAEIYYITRLPAKLETSDVTLVVVMALSLTFLAALYPAWRASRMDPAEILRNG